MRNISTSSHAEQPGSCSLSKWALTWHQRKQLQMETKCWKDFWVHDFFTYNLHPQWVYWPIICYMCSPIHKSTFEAVVCSRSLAFSIWILLTFDSQKLQISPNFVLIKNKQYKCLNFCSFVWLFCFVSMIWDTSLLPHPRLPSNERSQWIRLRLKLSLSKKAHPRQKEKW